MAVKVRNLNKYVFEQKYQGKLISIPPGDYVEMDDEDAVIFLGMFSPFKRDNKGQDDPKYFKMLKIERDPKAADSIEVPKFLCNACKEQTSSWTELEAHMRLMHSDQLVKDAEYEKYLAQKATISAKANISAGVSKSG